MSSVPALNLTVENADNARLAHVCGPLDGNLRLIEERLGLEIRRQGDTFNVAGAAAEMGCDVLRTLYERAGSGLRPEDVHLALVEASAGGTDEVKVQTLRGQIRGRGANQVQYLRQVRRHDLTFGIGPAGTGKTYLAVACAVEALQSDRVRRIVLVRPAVEAGERLGFLPGDLTQKVDPYLRPMYDALYEMVGFDKVAKLIERNVIEIAPLAFVILDEAQNTTIEQMKMFLTRIGFGSKAVVTGDVTQIDLPSNRPSGLRHVIDILPGVNGVAFTFFRSRDVVRHPLVQRIVQAYESSDTGGQHHPDSRLEAVGDERHAPRGEGGGGAP
jgi:phosphate starvation-inducible protein PhoH and related proteins